MSAEARARFRRLKRGDGRSRGKRRSRLVKFWHCHFSAKYTEYIDGCGMALLPRVCELDLEGIVAKEKSARYVTEREHSTWFKILNRKYSQMQGREELFERERRQEPVPGWHSCAIACAKLEEAS